MPNVDKVHPGRNGKKPELVDLYVGSRIRLRRAELGMSQHELAARLGIAFQQVQKYEVGRNRVSASRLLSISRVFGVSTSYFFDGIDRIRGDEQAGPSSLQRIVNDPSMLRLLRTIAQIDSPAIKQRAAVVVRTLAG